MLLIVRMYEAFGLALLAMILLASPCPCHGAGVVEELMAYIREDVVMELVFYSAIGCLSVFSLILLISLCFRGKKGKAMKQE